MNYQRHYDALILKAQNRSKPEGYTEKHHIVPRSLGGSNDANNLVVLTAREHCVAHLLLAKIHGGGMWHAASMMLSFHKIKSSRIYAMVREAHAIEVSKLMSGENNFWFGRTGEKSARFGKTHSAETKIKMSKAHLGKHVGENNPRFGKFGIESTVFKGNVYATNIKSGEIYELIGAKHMRELGFNPSHVSECINGHRKTHKGFTFKRISDIVKNTSN